MSTLSVVALINLLNLFVNFLLPFLINSITLLSLVLTTFPKLYSNYSQSTSYCNKNRTNTVFKFPNLIGPGFYIFFRRTVLHDIMQYIQ